MIRSYHKTFSRAVILTGLVITGAARAQTIYHVDVVVCPATGSGTDVDPFCMIQAGIDAAADGDTVLVAPGTYHEAIDLGGKAITLRGSAGAEATTVDATGLEASVVSVASDSNAQARIEGLTISGGSGTSCGSAATQRCGGGVYVHLADVTISDSVIVGNSADLGGGLYVVGTTRVDRCVLSGNDSTQDGGAFYAGEGSLQIANTVIHGNNAMGDGGALSCSSFTPVDVAMINATLVGNTANRGGAVFSGRFAPLIANSILWDNAAVTSGDQIYHEDGAQPAISYCDIAGSGGSDEWDPALGDDRGNNLDVDPLFADPSAADYHLQNGSPCLDAGNTSASVAWSEDLDGSARFRQATHGWSRPGGWPQVDLGAYELLLPGYCGNSVCESDESTSNCAYDCGDADGVLHVPEEFPTIQAAVWTAAAGDEIVVAPGIYDESVQLQGRPVHLRSTAGAESTVIDAGAAQTRGVTIDRGEGPDTVFEGFTILGGHAKDGGGMYIAQSSPTIRACRFVANEADSSGGGLYVQDGQPTIDGCMFLANTGHDGGGVYTLRGQTTIRDSSFFANSAQQYGAGLEGTLGDTSGAVNGVLNVVRCNFVGNQATSGGGLSVDHGTCTVTDSTFRANRNRSNSVGGGLSTYHANTVVDHCNFFDNYSEEEGGAIFASKGTLSVLSSHFEGNTVSVGPWSDSYGGAICVDALDEDLVVDRCALFGNVADNGGAIVNWLSGLQLSNSVITGNRAASADWSASAVFIGSAKSPFHLVNCTIADNVGRVGAAIAWDNSLGDPKIASSIDNTIVWSNRPEPVAVQGDHTLMVGYSDLEGGVGEGIVDGGGNIDGEPLFLRPPAAVQGGTFSDYGDLRLRSGSPGIDAGNNLAVREALDADVLGLPRFADDPCVDDTGSGEAPIVDMGAYEFHAEPTCGDGACTGDETCWSCRCDCGPCCGDGVCDDFESCVSCPEDCACHVRYVPDEYATIQDAIDASDDGDEVVVSPGVYHETFDFAGKPITVRSEAGAAETIIDGENQLGPIVLCTSGEGSDTVLEGLTLRRGRAAQGGAMFNYLSSPMIQACVFDGNRATGEATSAGGGAIYNDSANPTIRSCLFTRNHAFGNGGAILSGEGSSPTVIDSVFVGNEGSDGGACFLSDAAIKIIHCSFSGNRADYSGGAIFSQFADATVTGCVVSGNFAPWYPGIGGWDGHAVPLSPVITFSDIQNSGGSEHWDALIGADGGGNVDAAPLFRREPDAGADGWGDNPDTPDLDEGANDDLGDLRLRSESPCIDHGDDEAFPAEVTTDFDELPRFVADGCSSGSDPIPTALADMGAYELQVPATCGDGVCGDGESCESCACDCGSCCGNGVCDPFETCLACPSDCPCRSIRVPEDAPGIQAAIEAARDGDEILVAPGTYHETIDYLGKLVRVRSTGGPDVTVLDGTGLADGVVLLRNGETAQAVLEGFTVSGFAGAEQHAITVMQSGLTIRGCVIRDNTSEASGGALYGLNAEVALRDSTLINNQSDRTGGAVYIWKGTLQVEHCTFRANGAHDDGALGTEECDLTIRDSAVNSNHAIDDCGGLCCTAGKISMSRCTITDNAAGGNGGGIALYVAAGSTVSDSVFLGNSSTFGGGAAISGGPIMINRCRFLENSARDCGGLWAGSLQGIITNSLFVGNRAVTSGAVFVHACDLEFNLQACTVAFNQGAAGTGLVFGRDRPDGLPPSNSTVTNCVIYEPGGPTITNNDGSTVTTSYCVVDAGVEGVGNIHGDPRLVRPASDGGDGWGDNPDTPDVDEGANDDFGDLRLQAASPAINVGDPSVMFTPGAADLAGHPRVLCGRVDMGCYEFGIGDYDCDRMVSLGDFAAWVGCMTAPDNGQLDAGCEAFDFDNDNDVDIADYAGFQNEFSGL